MYELIIFDIAMSCEVVRKTYGHAMFEELGRTSPTRTGPGFWSSDDAGFGDVGSKNVEKQAGGILKVFKITGRHVRAF